MISRLWLFGLAGLLAGCSASEASLVGKYRGETVSTSSQGSLASNLEKGLASSVSLDLKSDKTFHMVATFVPIDGKWSVSGDKVTLTPDKVFGFGKSDGATISSDKPMEFRSTGKGLEPANPDNRFRFVKEKANGEAEIP